MKRWQCKKQLAKQEVTASHSDADRELYEQVKDVDRNTTNISSHLPMVENTSCEWLPNIVGEQQDEGQEHIKTKENKCYGSAPQHEEPIYALIEDEVNMKQNDAYQVCQSSNNQQTSPADDCINSTFNEKSWERETIEVISTSRVLLAGTTQQSNSSTLPIKILSQSDEALETASCKLSTVLPSVSTMSLREEVPCFGSELPSEHEGTPSRLSSAVEGVSPSPLLLNKTNRSSIVIDIGE